MQVQPNRSQPDGRPARTKPGGKRQTVPKTPIYAGQRVVGAVWGDTFKKNIHGSKHLLKQPPAIAFDLGTLDQAERAGAKQARVTDLETGTVYQADICAVREHGFTFDRGFGRQIALTLDRWAVVRQGHAERTGA